jgi:hypothetical protein
MHSIVCGVRFDRPRRLGGGHAALGRGLGGQEGRQANPPPPRGA